jgi:hypothetical protein
MAARVKNFRFIHRVSVFARSARHINAYLCRDLFRPESDYNPNGYVEDLL